MPKLGEIAASLKPSREKRLYDPDRMAIPLIAEEEEGFAYKALKESPDDETLKNKYAKAFNKLQMAVGRDFSLVRCSHCHVQKWGRQVDDPCGYCGKEGGYYG